MVDQVNRKIAAAIRTPPQGPPLNLMPLNIDEIVHSWRQDGHRR